MNCNICPRKCNINRDNGVGFCNAPSKLKIAKYMLHMWEEPIISGTNGSGAIFFSHCNLKCVYCQNEQISSGGEGKFVSVSQLVEIIKELECAGAHNINFVTPTHYTEQIIQALEIYKPAIPIVWNSSGYESAETIKKLKDLVDVYLVDIKYMENELAFNLSKAKDYPKVCAEAVLQMRKNEPIDIIESGLMQKGIIIRHLVLPNEVQNSFQVLDWINENMGNDTYISLMGQYTPCYLAKTMKKYNRPLKPIEYKRVINKFNALGFKNGFCQELTSADEKFIPDFDKFNNK
jgi:putative pyruvate formate lyase activating enzyme